MGMCGQCCHISTKDLGNCICICVCVTVPASASVSVSRACVGHGLSFGKKIFVRALSTLLGQIQDRDLVGLFFTCSQPTRNRGFYACAMCSAGSGWDRAKRTLFRQVNPKRFDLFHFAITEIQKVHLEKRNQLLGTAFESRIPRCDSREALHCLARRFVSEHENTFKLKSVSTDFHDGVKAPCSGLQP